MVFVRKRINMKGTNTCLNCLHMNPRNGYCPKAGEYVNAFWTCQRVEEAEPDAKPPELPPKPKRMSPMKGVRFTANRVQKRCSRCGKVKPIDEFVKCSRNADGHSCYCYECGRLNRREDRARKKKREALKNADDNSDK